VYLLTSEIIITPPVTVLERPLVRRAFLPLTRGWMLCAAAEGFRLIKASQSDPAAAQSACVACTREGANLQGVVGKPLACLVPTGRWGSCSKALSLNCARSIWSAA
jgi:hypothetical protein